MKNLLSIDLGPLRGFGKLGLETDTVGSTSIEVFSKFITTIIGIMTIVAIIWFVFIFITGAISWMSGGGDKNALEAAKKRITTGIIGLAVTVIAIFVIDLIGNLIGITDILNIPYWFNLITGSGSTGGGGSGRGVGNPL